MTFSVVPHLSISFRRDSLAPALSKQRRSITHSERVSGFGSRSMLSSYESRLQANQPAQDAGIFRSGMSRCCLVCFDGLRGFALQPTEADIKRVPVYV